MGQGSGGRCGELPGMGCTPSSPGPPPTPPPSNENPERWECKCDPEAGWTAVWRILTPEQVRQKFAHLSTGRTPARDTQRRELRAHIAEIRAEQEPTRCLRRCSSNEPSGHGALNGIPVTVVQVGQSTPASSVLRRNAGQ
jgi:hypothetical protein